MPRRNYNIIHTRGASSFIAKRSDTSAVFALRATPRQVCQGEAIRPVPDAAQATCVSILEEERKALGGRVFDIRREDPQHIDTHMVFIKDLQ